MLAVSPHHAVSQQPAPAELPDFDHYTLSSTLPAEAVVRQRYQVPPGLIGNTQLDFSSCTLLLLQVIAHPPLEGQIIERTPLQQWLALQLAFYHASKLPLSI